MGYDKNILKSRIILMCAVAVVAVILGLLFFKFPDNSNATFAYETDTQGNATIKGYTGSVKTLEIPSEIEGYTVRHIADNAFGSADSIIEKVIIADTVTEIGKDAFSNCPKLKKVIFSDSLEKIGYAAFENCVRLTVAELPQTLKTIDDFAFNGCIRLKKLSVPSTVEYIGQDAFFGCENLVLDVSENALAKQVAQDYHIPTDYFESSAFITTLAISLGVIAVVVIFTALYVIKKRKQKQKTDKENRRTE